HWIKRGGRCSANPKYLADRGELRRDQGANSIRTSGGKPARFEPGSLPMESSPAVRNCRGNIRHAIGVHRSLPERFLQETAQVGLMPAVKPLGIIAEDFLFGLFRNIRAPAQRGYGARKQAVPVRIVGSKQNHVRAEIVNDVRQLALVGLGGAKPMAVFRSEER